MHFLELACELIHHANEAVRFIPSETPIGTRPDSAERREKVKELMAIEAAMIDARVHLVHHANPMIDRVMAAARRLIAATVAGRSLGDDTFAEAENAMCEAVRDAAPWKATKRPEPEPEAKDELDRESRALGLAVQHGDWTYKQIASAMGLDDSHKLYRCRKLVKYMRGKKEYPLPANGRKSKDGDIEAVDDG